MLKAVWSAADHGQKRLVTFGKAAVRLYGKHEVLFGTDWPVIDPERAVAEIRELAEVAAPRPRSS